MSWSARNSRSGGWAAALLVLGLVASAGAQTPSASSAPTATAARLRVSGTIPTPLDLGTVDIGAMPHQEVRADDTHGRSGLFRGVDLLEILRRSGAPLGEALRGPQLRLVVRVECADGYVVVFSLAELDPDLGGRRVLLADARDGAPLTPEEGPWRLVVPEDKRPARWARQVAAIRIAAMD